MSAWRSKAGDGNFAELVEIDVCVPSLDPLAEGFVRHLEERLPIHCLLTSNLPGRGRARQALIQRVDTDWFAFVDTDVQLRVNWWPKVTRLVRPSVGGVEGLWSYARSDQRVDDYGKSMEKLARRLGRRGWSERVDRAFTGDTLIRKEAVEQIRIPTINIYEDEYIRRHIVGKGYEWIRTPIVVCDHMRTYNLAEAYEAGRFAYFFGQMGPLRQLRRLSLTPLKILFALGASGNVGIVEFVTRKEITVLRGVLHARVQDEINPDFKRRVALNGTIR
jgi:hypothetical protein